MIELCSTGAPNLVQDLGRTGHLAIGVSRSGAMDTLALRTANALVGNDDAAAGIEIGLFPFRLRFLADAPFALTGAPCGARLDDRQLPPWWAQTARAGQMLVLDPPALGLRAYLSVGGGLDVPMVLGSRSTDLKSGFGGVEGRGLRRGDVIAVRAGAGRPLPEAGLGALPPELAGFFAELATGRVSVRVLCGAEHGAFTEAARATFASSDWLVTAEANRMGYRLSGPPLELTAPLELFSHGILPGTIQVPPSGQPVIQLAEANTCGGYPKIGAVIEADLWRLAQAPVGTRLRFVPTQLDAAIAALRAQRDDRAALRRDLALMLNR